MILSLFVYSQSQLRRRHGGRNDIWREFTGEHIRYGRTVKLCDHPHLSEKVQRCMSARPSGFTDLPACVAFGLVVYKLIPVTTTSQFPF